jgi:hypothetical protein
MLVTDGAQSACNLGGGDAGGEATVATPPDVEQTFVWFENTTQFL